ncbi:phage portal protein [Morganella morganii]|uniref:phage portal protein n=1 Tax=Morganella morganii TaxID=582 RepID=UPI0006918E5F|nr:phage portal protein [Morganella morganii]
MALFKKLTGLFRRGVTGHGFRSGYVREPFAGAWQMNAELGREDVLSYHPVFSCITLIASDIAKMPLLLKRKNSTGIWQNVSGVTRSVMTKPNTLQTRNQFFENWMNSKLTTGNTYVFKERDSKGSVTALHVLDPHRITPLITEDGEVFYQLGTDNVTGITQSVTVPAREIIHDRFNCLYHPLIGLPPVYACALSASQGTAIMKNATRLFINGGKPGGIIEIPGKISQEDALELKQTWEASYGGENAGKTGLLTEGAKYNTVSVSPVDSQLVEQLRLTAEIICSVFHVPLYKVGLGEVPSYNNVEALDQQYYSQCLQSHIEGIEVLLAEGLDLPVTEKIEFDLDALMRMDTPTRFKAHNEAIKGGWLAPNEARRKENLAPVEGGDTPYLQQQNYSLSALSKRDNAPDNPEPPEQKQSETENKTKAVTDTESEVYEAVFREATR